MPDDPQNSPEIEFEPGELAPHWYSSFANAELTPEAENALKALVDRIGQRDVAARRWEVEQAWEARLFYRGYQYLLPKRGGGWTLPPFATDYSRNGSGRAGARKFFGYETNIYATYGEIISAALTRDIPEVRFEPQNPMNDADVTAAEAANKYKKVFAKNNDLLDFQSQLVWYLANDGRALIVTNHVIDAQRFGRETPESAGAVPETEAELEKPVGFIFRHGATPLNELGIERGRSSISLDQNGVDAAKQIGQVLKRHGVQRLISSPLPRAQESTQIVGDELGIPYSVDDHFASLDLGDTEGMPKEKANPIIAEYDRHPDQKLPGSTESFDDLDDRVREGLFEQFKKANGPFAIGTHNSVISAANRVLTGVDDHGADFIPPGGVAALYEAPGGAYTIRKVFPADVPADATPMHRGTPRGMEIVEVGGKLEHKVPINALTIHDCMWVQYSREYDVTYAKAMCPEKADKIEPGGHQSGENELDRIARINAALALEASYVTGDSMVRDCTISRTWMRPGFFMEEELTTEVRTELTSKFPDGALTVFAGKAFLFARNECMDDHLTLVQAYPGAGMNRLALCSKLLSVQKRLNNWVDLLNDYFIRTVPLKHMNSRAYDLDAIRNQPNVPGGIVAFQSQPGLTSAEQYCFLEPTPTPQPVMPQTILFWIQQLPQLLSGATPALFGADSNTDTALGQRMQRDQALERLGTPWHAIQTATCSYFRQAVQLAARCRAKGICQKAAGDIISISLSDMKGNVLAYPMEDANFPESWNQRQFRYQRMLAEASTNPMYAQMLSTPKNLKFAQEMAGMGGFEVPGADAYDKQLGELNVLLKTGPVPNPQKMAMRQAYEEDFTEYDRNLRAGVPRDPEKEQQLERAFVAIQAMPDMVSTVPVDPETDNHAVEAGCLLDWMNSPVGRRFRNGSARQREAFQNAKLHWMEHDNLAQEKVKQRTQIPPKGLSLSANVKDLPPAEAAQALTKAGFQSSPADFETNENTKMARAANKASMAAARNVNTAQEIT